MRRAAQASAPVTGLANPHAAPPEDTLIYVYGVARAGAMTPSSAALVEGLVPGTFVELVPDGDLAAVISRVPWDAFAPGGTAADGAGNLAAERVLAHHRVLANLAMFASIAPVKFGVIRRNLDDVLAAVAGSTAAFAQALARVDGAQEWRVKLHADVDVCRAAVRAALMLKPRQAGHDPAAAGRVFFRHGPLHDLDGEVLRDLAARARSVHRLVAARTREAAPDACCGLGAGWNGYAPALILKSAYLVEKACEAGFKQAMADLGDALEAEGCILDVSGPLPPYSFAAVDIDSAG